ncbi:hypothetical protein ACJJTC_005453 [Scirpophaga incertulas]
MPPTIVSPAACEVRAVIRFLSAKGVKPIDIHREICEVYGQNIMSDGMVRKWVRAFKDGRTNVHDEERSGRPSVVNEDLVQKVDEKRGRMFGAEIYLPLACLRGSEVLFAVDGGVENMQSIFPILQETMCNLHKENGLELRKYYQA